MESERRSAPFRDKGPCADGTCLYGDSAVNEGDYCAPGPCLASQLMHGRIIVDRPLPERKG